MLKRILDCQPGQGTGHQMGRAYFCCEGLSLSHEVAVALFRQQISFVGCNDEAGQQG